MKIIQKLSMYSYVLFAIINKYIKWTDINTSFSWLKMQLYCVENILKEIFSYIYLFYLVDNLTNIFSAYLQFWGTFIWLKTYNYPSYFAFLKKLGMYNWFTMLYWFKVYSKVELLYKYIYSQSLLDSFPVKAITKYQIVFPVLYCRYLLVIYFI